MAIYKAYGTPFYNSSRATGRAIGNLRVRRGMGDCNAETGEDCVDTTTYGQQSGGSYPQPVGTTSTNWSGLLNTLTNSFTSIYKAVQPTGTGCTQYTGPNGQSYTSCSGTSQAPAVPNLFGGVGGGSSMLWILALGLGAVLLIGGRK